MFYYRGCRKTRLRVTLIREATGRRTLPAIWSPQKHCQVATAALPSVTAAAHRGTLLNKGRGTLHFVMQLKRIFYTLSPFCQGWPSALRKLMTFRFQAPVWGSFPYGRGAFSSLIARCSHYYAGDFFCFCTPGLGSYKEVIILV